MRYGLERGWPFSWTLKGPLHMAVLTPQRSPTLLTYFLFPAWLPLGATISTQSKYFFPSNSVGFGPGREPNGRRARTPQTLLPAGRKAQRHTGTGLPGPPGNQPPGTLGTLGPPQKGSHGGSGSYLLRFRRGAGNIVTSF